MTPGWWGKLAMLGDFASRRLEPGWVARMDDWVSGGMYASRQMMGEQWLARYLAAPTWRFVLGPGVVDAQWWLGVLMPSCDSAGRYFPLLVAQPAADLPADDGALTAWWTALARAAQATLADGASVDGFEAALAALPPPPAAGPLPPAQPLPGRERLALVEAGELLAPLGRHALAQRLMGCSLWWLPGVSCTFTAGLPQAEDFAALWTAQW